MHYIFQLCSWNLQICAVHKYLKTKNYFTRKPSHYCIITCAHWRDKLQMYGHKIYTHVHTQLHTPVHIHIHVHTHTYVHIHTYTHARTHAHTYAHTHTHTHTQGHAQLAHTHVYTCIHVHTCLCTIHTSLSWLLLLLPHVTRIHQCSWLWFCTTEKWNNPMICCTHIQTFYLCTCS